MLVVVGDSHTIALRHGLEQLKRALGAGLEQRYGPVVAGQLDHGYKFLQRFHSAVGRDAVELTDARAQEILGKLVSPTSARITRDDPRRFVFCIGFHPSGSMQARHWTQHTCAPSRAGEKQFVSRAALGAFVRSYNAAALTFFADLQRLNVRFSVAACNPLPPAFLEHWKTASFAPEEIVAFHRRYWDAFRDELDALGIRYHLPPPSVYDENGLMWQALANDTKQGDYHANGTYGALMMEHILGDLFGAFDEERGAPTQRGAGEAVERT